MNNTALKTSAAVSFLLNILLIGIIIGYVFSDRHHFSKRHQNNGIHALLRTLPQEKSALLSDTVTKSRKSARNNHRQIKEIRQQAATLLIADPFQVDAFKSKLLEINTLRNDTIQHKTLTIVHLATQMTQNERKSLSKYLLKDKKYRKKQ